jgi:hypothetical protein
MSNPYQPPSFDPNQNQDAAYPATHPGFGWVNQVRIVAVLNCVQGGLEIPLGLMLMAASLFVPTILQAQKGSMPPGAVPPQQMEQILKITYLAIGTPMVLAGVLRIYAGIQNFRFRSRMLGIASLALGLVSVVGCYCSPTSIAVLIYGLIVYLNPAVATAFDMGRQGMHGSAILAAFATNRPSAMPPDKA